MGGRVSRRAESHRPRGGRARRRLVSEQIVRVAADCFGEMGYGATTLDTIAARAGVSKVTLYAHVASKEELLWAVFERTIAEFRRGLAAIVTQDLPADETLRRIVRYQVGLLTSHLPFLTVFFSEEGRLPPRLARRVAEEKRAYDRAIEQVVRRGIREQRVRALPPTVFVFALLGMTNWLYQWFRPAGRLRPEQIAEIFVDLLERGYLADGASGEGSALAATLARIDERLARLERHVAPGRRGGRRR